MLNRFAKFLLVSTSIAPILLTWAFVDWHENGPEIRQLLLLVSAFLIVFLCGLIICAANKWIAVTRMQVESLKSADTEVVGFLVAYLLPFLSYTNNSFDPAILVFISCLLGLIVWSTNAYSVNPLLSLLGYHFYEITNKDGVTFMLMSRREIRSVKEVEKVIQLTRYVLIDRGRGNG